jgi:hypothetical protein
LEFLAAPALLVIADDEVARDQKDLFPSRVRLPRLPFSSSAPAMIFC